MNWLKVIAFCPLAAFAQLVPPPSGSQPVDLDTVSGVDTSLFTLQIPPYLNGSSVKLRRVTLGQVAEYVSNVYPGCDSACQAKIIDSLQVRFGDSISVPYLHATDSLRTPRIKIPAYVGQFNIDAEAGDDVRLRIYYDSEAKAAYFSPGDSGIALYLPELQVQNASIGGGPTKKVGFFGTTPKVRCTVTTGTVPNPVTDMANYVAYAQSVQDCLDQSHLNLIGAP